MQNKRERVSKEGENCWRVEPSRRVRIFTDTASYFEAFAQAVESARETVFIAGWDLHSQLELRRGNSSRKPTRLGDILEEAVKKNRFLEIYILLWDFAMLYLGERELFPVVRLGWNTSSRIRFRMDGKHPLGASHHQKIVVVDDHIAFSGGIDLSQWRWDTSEHFPGDNRRVDPSGKSYMPFHDMQMGVEGEAARALGELFRDRWKRVTGDDIPPLREERISWPGEWPVDFENVEVSLALTWPAYRDEEQVRQVERLHLDSFRAARKWIYIENQYLTSAVITDGLCEVLEKEEGPEVVIVLPMRLPGWLEEGSMGLMREKALRRLERSDIHGRLLLRYPSWKKEAGEEQMIMVHAKCTIIDETFLRVGSANLSNRSMGVDSECDLVIEAEPGSGTDQEVTRVRNNLLALHLSVREQEVRARLEETGSLVRTIQSLEGNERSLRELPPAYPRVPGHLIPGVTLYDPERPIDPEEFVRTTMPEKSNLELRKAVLPLLVIIIVFLAMAALWRWSPLNQWIQPEALREYALTLKKSPWEVPAIIAAYSAGSFMMIPLTAMVSATALIYDTLPGFFLALGGSWLAAMLTYLAGRFLARLSVRKIAGKWIHDLNTRMKTGSVLIVAALRLVPVAPFTVVNLVAGSLRVSAPIFGAGTLLGLVPGTAAVILVTGQVTRMIANPEPGTILLGAGVILAVLAIITLATWWARRLLKRNRSEEEKG
jgi:phosphatidylserine/phosphatidylglycerophosphate/cardiolipin synthase-like enzyme